MVYWAHLQRFDEAKGTAKYLMKYETYFSNAIQDPAKIVKRVSGVDG